jgi:hypothetical protein
VVADDIQVGMNDNYRIRMGAGDDMVRIDWLSPNKDKHIAILVTKGTAVDGAFIAIGDDTGKNRFLHADGVDRFNQEDFKQK